MSIGKKSPSLIFETMELLIVLAKIFAGLALLIFSISQLSHTLKKISGVRFRKILERTTSNPFKGIFTGASITFLVQSSSVTVLLLLGLVNAGIMNLKQAVFVILGSGIGTTITAQIVAFKLKVVFYPFIATGFALKVISKKEHYKNIGDIIFYLGLIFLSMGIMSDGSKPLKEYPFFIDTIRLLGVNPLWGIFLGAVFTAITSSSSATTSLVIAMSMEGVIPLQSGIALIIGANIGTCVLELVATIGTNCAAKRTGLAQFMVNLVGAVIFYPFLGSFTKLIAMTGSEVPRLIANAHTIFNVTVSLFFVPFVGLLVFFLEKVIPDHGRSEIRSSGVLDEKFLAVPSMALYEVEQEVNRMASIAEEMLLNARKAFVNRDNTAYAIVKESEKTIDAIYEGLSVYLGKISTLMLSEKDSKRKLAFAHAITDIERIADLAENLAEYSRQKEIVFSGHAMNTIEKVFDNTLLTYSSAVKSLKRNMKSIARDVNLLELKAVDLELQLRDKYLVRTEGDTLKPRIDALYPSALLELKRISDHANNVAHYVLKM
ncbi:MAG: Na/Pi cotransporter family protein [Candidatus Electrothrix communis]|nr:MAG: Na/Pi cotransporter family protein [Candidatus Electrothrix communis]